MDLILQKHWTHSSTSNIRPNTEHKSPAKILIRIRSPPNKVGCFLGKTLTWCVRPPLLLWTISPSTTEQVLLDTQAIAPTFSFFFAPAGSGGDYEFSQVRSEGAEGEIGDKVGADSNPCRSSSRVPCPPKPHRVRRREPDPELAPSEANLGVSLLWWFSLGVFLLVIAML
ncbi:hypothetical protein Drorol1_Dr00012562 [Drosera rotundifolia]